MERQNITPIKNLLVTVRNNTTNSDLEIFYLMPENYEQIVFLKEKNENRKVSSTNVRSKKASIQKIGLVAARPVLVDAELFNKYNIKKRNFKDFVFPISDGQHLVKAAKELNLPIPFCIVSRPEDVTFKEFIRNLNASNKPWSLYTFHEDEFRQIYEDITSLPFFNHKNKHNKANFVFSLYTGDFHVGEYLKGFKPLKKLKYHDVIVAKLITLDLDDKFKVNIRKIFPMIELYKLYYRNYSKYFNKIDFEDIIKTNKEKDSITDVLIKRLQKLSGDYPLIADNDFYGEFDTEPALRKRGRKKNII